MKLALVISSLGGGGAERVLATLANAWARSGVQVRVITLGAKLDCEYPLDAGIERIALDSVRNSAHILQAVRNNWRRIRALRRALRVSDPDAVISFVDTTNVLSVLASLGLQVPVVVSDRIFVDAMPPPGIWQKLYRFAYRRAAVVVAQTQRAAEATRRRIGRDVVVIPNPLRGVEVWRAVLSETDGNGLLAKCQSYGKTLLAMGRLVEQKGFDLLLDAFALVAEAHRDWQLVILGEGPLRAELERRFKALGLDSRVALPGFMNQPESLIRGADLFVMSSRFEGFPNALLEAMAEGKPCVSFDCPTGPRELIQHGVNGWLAAPEDVSALAAALDTLMSNPGLRASLGEHAQSVRDVYAVPAVLDQWNRLLESVGIAVPANICRARVPNSFGAVP